MLWWAVKSVSNWRSSSSKHITSRLNVLHLFNKNGNFEWLINLAWEINIYSFFFRKLKYMYCELIQQIPSSMRIWKMRIKHANLPHVAVWRHLKGIGAKAYYIVICCRLIIGTFWAQPINILYRDEQEFGRPDASGA